MEATAPPAKASAATSPRTFTRVGMPLRPGREVHTTIFMATALPSAARKTLSVAVAGEETWGALSQLFEGNACKSATIGRRCKEAERQALDCLKRDVGLMNKTILCMISAAIFVSGCSQTPVMSINQRTGERFIGIATSGSGDISITNSRGVNCIGSFNSQVVLTVDSGFSRNGALNCADGRSGTFTVAGTARGGQGIGILGNDEVRIFYGQFANVQVLQ